MTQEGAVVNECLQTSSGCTGCDCLSKDYSFALNGIGRVLIT